MIFNSIYWRNIITGMRFFMVKGFDINLELILKNGLDISPDCFGILDQDDVVIYCNDTFASVFGLSKKEAIGQTNKELLRFAWSKKKGIIIETDDFDKWYQNIEDLHHQKLLNQFETDLTDGRWFQMTRMNLPDDYIFLFGSEISDLKKTQISLEQANQQIEVLANTDQLTGINNRRSFNIIAKQEVKRAMRYQQSLSLLLIDLDFFKRINDSYGHEAGDTLLKKFTQLCNEELRESDYFARIGGEEFTVLLPMTRGSDAYAIAERIRTKIATHEFYLSVTAPCVKISVSIGVSSLMETDQSIKNLLEQADLALYTAKNNGRNLVMS